MTTYDRIELWHLEKNDEGDMVPVRLCWKNIPPYNVIKPPQIIKYGGKFYVFKRLPEYWETDVIEVSDPPKPEPEALESSVADVSVLLKSMKGE